MEWWGGALKSRVSFRILNPTEFLSVRDYPSLGINVHVDVQKATGFDVIVEHSSRAGHDLIVEKGEEKLAPLLELIQLGQGFPLNLGAASVQAIEPASPIALSLAGHKADTLVSRQIPMPPETLVKGLSSKVTLQLQWYNKAIEARRVIDRIRNLYKVLELEKNLSHAAQSPYEPPQEAKWLRDAVSHAVVDNKSVKNYLMAQIGSDHIDPSNKKHIRFLEEKAAILRREAERILMEKLPKWWP